MRVSKTGLLMHGGDRIKGWRPLFRANLGDLVLGRAFSLADANGLI